MSDLCGRKGCEKTGMKKCSGCKSVSYCDKSCQREHWKEHRPMCKKIEVSRKHESFFPEKGVEANANLFQEMEGMVRLVGAGSQLPKYHDEYAAVYTDNKKIVAKLSGGFGNSTVSLMMIRSGKFGDFLTSYGNLGLILNKRWRLFAPELLFYINSDPKPGTIAPFYHGLSYGQCSSSKNITFLMLRNTYVHKKMFKPGSHVSVGFVDLSQLLFASLDPADGQVAWHGYEMNILLVARARLLVSILTEPDYEYTVILQVWFSSLLSQEAETAMRKACSQLAEVEKCPQLKSIFRYWARTKLDCRTALSLWSHNIGSSDIETVGQLAEKEDRVFYAHYLFHGSLFLGKDKAVSGNLTLLSIPEDMKESYIKQYDNVFKSLPVSTFYSGSLEKSIEKGTRLGLDRLRNNLTKGKLVISIHLGKVDISDANTIKEIKNLNAATIDWSNLPDFIPPIQFKNIISSVSASDTVHSAHFMNWMCKVFGTFPLDFLPQVITADMLHTEIKDPSGTMDKLGLKLVSERLEVLKKTLPNLKFLHQNPNFHTVNFMSFAQEILAHPFKQSFVDFYFPGATACLEYPIPHMDRVNPFGVESVINVTFKG